VLSQDQLFLAVPRRTYFYTLDSLLALNGAAFIDAIHHLILPAIALSYASLAVITRLMRSSMLDVLGAEYIKTARSKGLSEKIVVRKHAVRNALIPTTTVIGLAFGGLLGGAILTETVFNWPGLGRWSADAILGADRAAILGFTLLAAIVYVVVNLIVDLTYAYLDPRIRLE
jgi:peptide/nickel transport system permease protein